MTTHSEDLVSLDELRSILTAHAGPDEPLERPTRHRLRDLRRANRRLVAAAVIVVALALPALAFSGALGSPFGFSNRGTPIPTGDFETIHALSVTGAKPGSLVKLAARDGLGVYAARRTKLNHPWASHLCFYTGPTDGSNLNLGGGCVKPWGNSGVFPSRSHPVWDMSIMGSSVQFPQLPPGGGTVIRLVGVAADGVRSVQVLALSNCQAVVTAPVIDNVYVATKLPLTAEAFIVARDANGKAIWQRLVSTRAKQGACGLNGGDNRRAGSSPPPNRANGFKRSSGTCDTPPSAITLVRRASAAPSAEGGCVDGGIATLSSNRGPAAILGHIPSNAEPVAVGGYQGYFLSHAPPDGPVDPGKTALYVYIPGAAGPGHVEYLVLDAKGLTQKQLIAAAQSALPTSPTSTTQTCTENCG
jgi:hypothetical protein